MYCMMQFQNPVYDPKFRYIQAYCGILRTLCNSCIFRNLPYSEFWHISNRRRIQNSVKACSGILRTLCNARILRTPPYSGLIFAIFRSIGIFRTQGIFRILFIQTHSGTFTNDRIVIITITLFFHLNRTFISTKLKRHVFDYNEVNFNALLNLLK